MKDKVIKWLIEKVAPFMGVQVLDELIEELQKIRDKLKAKK